MSHADEDTSTNLHSSLKSITPNPTQLIALGGLFTLIVLFTVLRFWQVTWANNMWVFLHYHGLSTLLLLSSIGLFTAAGFFISAKKDADREDYRHSFYSRSEEEKKETPKTHHKRNIIIALSLGTLLFIGYIFFIFTSGYRADKKMLESVQVTNVAAPNFEIRTPYAVAQPQAQGGITVNGRQGNTTYIGSQQAYGTIVQKPGLTTGYAQIVSQTFSTTGQANTTTCSFKANKAIGAMFGGNLARAIEKQRFGVQIDADDDAYGYCDGKTPMVVIPMTKPSGWVSPYPVPAGTAVYNGMTGEIKIYDHLKAGQIPGPTYPLSLSYMQRTATSASGSWWNYMQNMVGFADTSNDKDDPNADNNAEFNLAETDSDNDYYVTPLTRVGALSAVVALGYTENNEMNTGELNFYRVSMLPAARQANSSVMSRIKADYSSLPWATGMSVFEIAPTTNSSWTATLGLNKAIMYRVKVNADSTSCLYDTAWKKLGCSPTTPGTITSPADGGGTVPGDLSKLTPAQLLKLQEQITQELLKRYQSQQK